MSLPSSEFSHQFLNFFYNLNLKTFSMNFTELFINLTLIPNCFMAFIAAKTSSDLRRLYALDLPDASDENNTHLILKLYLHLQFDF